MADGSHGAGRVVRPKNRAPAPIQITAEQILVESRERAEQAAPPAPKRHITDPEELAEHRMRVRKEYEDRLRRLNKSVGTWLRYAKWEEGQGEVARARSIYERTLDVDPKEPGVWLRYAEMEMRAKFINRARNVLDRATALLPRVEALWFKYVFMEEMLGNVVGARALFERWMTWEPEERAWLSYANLELRAGSTERARGVYERYVACHPSQVAYLKYAKWEARNGQAALARRVLERALDELRDEERDAGLYAYFAKFEQECGEAERARAVFRLGLVALGEGGTGAASLHAAFLAFEKQHGSRAGIEEAIITKRRGTYEAAVGENPLNFDAWFDWVHLEESEVGGGGGGAAALSRVRDVFERAIANVPPIAEKRYWRRYVYLWLGYAVFEELVAKDGARARAVYKEALKVVPHRSFTFGKLWLLAAHAEVRAKDVGGARKLLGAALGMCPKPNIIQGYIELELALGELDRVRKLYERYVTLAPGSVVAWLKFAELERSVGETERARAIYDLAIGQTVMDRPELAWKAAIDFEVDAGDFDAARSLYTRLLSRTQHVKVWLAFAEFENGVVGSPSAARALYERAYAHFKAASGAGDDGDAVETRQQRAALVDAWRAFEAAGVEAAARSGGDTRLLLPLLRAVEAKQPRLVKKFRQLWAGGATAPPQAVVEGVPTPAPVSSEEYADFFFPDDDAMPAHLKLLEAAARWKAGGGGLGATAALAAAAAGGGGEEQKEGSGGGGGAAAAGAARGGAGWSDENEVNLDAEEEGGGGGGSSSSGGDGGVAPTMADILAGAVQAGRKRGRAEGTGSDGGGRGRGGRCRRGSGRRGALAAARDENELELDLTDVPPPPPPAASCGDGNVAAAPPPRRRALALPNPKND